MFGTRHDDAAHWQTRPRQLHTPPGVPFRFIAEPHAQGTGSLLLGAAAAVGLGLWTWRAVFALLFPEPPELPAYGVPARPELTVPAAAPARAAEPAAPPRAAAGSAPLRVRKPGPRLQPAAAKAPPFDPDAKPDMDLMDAPSSPLELRSLAEARARAPVSLAALPAITPTYLNLNSRPWSEVYVDGHSVGHTPIRNLRLLPGRYAVQLVNRQFGMGKQLEVLLLPGDRVTRSEELEEN